MASRGYTPRQMATVGKETGTKKPVYIEDQLHNELKKMAADKRMTLQEFVALKLQRKTKSK